MEIVQPSLSTPENPSDDLLLRRAREGDRAAFAELYQSRAGAIYRYALHMTGQTATAEEVLQETFLVLLKDVSGYQSNRGTLGAYLFGIARNRLRRQIAFGREFEPADEETTSDADLSADLIRRETIETVRRAVLTLPAVYREAVVLCELEEMAYDEAAALLCCPIGTVRSRLHRARAMLVGRLSALQRQKVGV